MDRNNTTLSTGLRTWGWLGLLLLSLSVNGYAQGQAQGQAQTQAQTQTQAKKTVAAAGAPTKTPLQSTLQQVETACRKDDLPAGSPAAVPQWEPDLGCGISVPELQKQLGSADLTLVDLRQREAFDAWHINGALNLSFAELHNKPYWRNKQVVLMGNGKAERESYSECRHLKQLGYTKVKVLRGGMPAWLAQQGAVLGRVNETVPHMLRLSAAEFWLEAQNLDHLLLLSPAQKALQQELPLSTTLEQETPAAMLTLLARHRKETGAAALSGVVLVAAPDVTDEQIMRLQQAIAPMPLLVYADTREAVQRQIALQKQIWLAQARGPRQLGCGL